MRLLLVAATDLEIAPLVARLTPDRRNRMHVHVEDARGREYRVGDAEKLAQAIHPLEVAVIPDPDVPARR